MALIKKIIPQKNADGETLKIRNPENAFRHIAPEGERVTWSNHWARAETRGEIKVEDDNQPTSAPKEEPKQEGPVVDTGTVSEQTAAEQASDAPQAASQEPEAYRSTGTRSQRQRL